MINELSAEQRESLHRASVIANETVASMRPGFVAIAAVFNQAAQELSRTLPTSSREQEK